MTQTLQRKIFLPLVLCLALSVAKAQDKTSANATSSLSSLPGKGLLQHDFLYTGEWDYRRSIQTIYIVRGGKIIWTYDIPFKDSTGTMEELGDATMRLNGNIVFCRKTGASEVTRDKKIIWNYEAPKGTEIHSVQPVENDKVLMVINGVPAVVKFIDVTRVKQKRSWCCPRVSHHRICNLEECV